MPLPSGLMEERRVRSDFHGLAVRLSIDACSAPWARSSQLRDAMGVLLQRVAEDGECPDTNSRRFKHRWIESGKNGQ